MFIFKKCYYTRSIFLNLKKQHWLVWGQGQGYRDGFNKAMVVKVLLYKYIYIYLLHVRIWLCTTIPWTLFFFHRLINHQIIKTGVSRLNSGGEWGSIFKNNRACFWTGVELLLQTMGLAHLSVLTVNQWAGTHIQTGYFCRLRFGQLLVGEHFYNNASQEFFLHLKHALIMKTSLFQVFSNNSDLFDIHVKWGCWDKEN